MPNFRTILTNLSIAALSFCGSLAIGEYALRYLVPSPYSIFDQRYRRWDFDQSLANGLFEPDAALGYAPSWRWLAGGRFGYQNGKEFGNEDRSAVDVALLGDSIVQDWRLKSALDALLEGRNVRVWNVGIGGYNTIQEAGYFEQRISFTPPRVVLAFCLNDFSNSLVAVPNGGASTLILPAFQTVLRVDPELFRSSAIYRAFKLSSIPSSAVYPPLSAEMIAVHTHNVRVGLRSLIETTNKRGAELRVLIYPPLMRYRKDWRYYARSAAVGLMKELDITYIDLHDDFGGEQMNRWRIMPQDTVHPNMAGHWLAARRLVETFPGDFGLTKEEAAKVLQERLGVPEEPPAEGPVGLRSRAKVSAIVLEEAGA